MGGLVRIREHISERQFTSVQFYYERPDVPVVLCAVTAMLPRGQFHPAPYTATTLQSFLLSPFGFCHRRLKIFGNFGSKKIRRRKNRGCHCVSPWCPPRTVITGRIDQVWRPSCQAGEVVESLEGVFPAPHFHLVASCSDFGFGIRIVDSLLGCRVIGWWSSTGRIFASVWAVIRCFTCWQGSRAAADRPATARSSSEPTGGRSRRGGCGSWRTGEPRWSVEHPPTAALYPQGGWSYFDRKQSAGMSFGVVYSGADVSTFSASEPCF